MLFFIQPGSREVHIAGITATPDGDWISDLALRCYTLMVFVAPRAGRESEHPQGL